LVGLVDATSLQRATNRQHYPSGLELDEIDRIRWTDAVNRGERLGWGQSVRSAAE
jgi:hypothetical protein